MTEMFGLKVGAQYRENDFNTHVSNLAPGISRCSRCPPA